MILEGFSGPLSVHFYTNLGGTLMSEESSARERPSSGGRTQHFWVVDKTQESDKESGQGRDRTGDTRIFSPVLYQLSYLSRESTMITSVARL